MTVVDDRAVWSRIWGFLEIPDLELAGAAGPASSRGYEISSVDMRFSLNSLPTAQFVVGVGKIINPETLSVLERATDTTRAQEFLHNLLYFKSVKARLRVRGSYTPDEVEWPEEDFILFDGYITGVLTTRAQSGLLVVLQCTHWLMDMNASSVLSGRFTASSGADILQSPQYDATNVGGGSEQSGAPNENVQQNISSVPQFTDLATEDLWVKSLKPLFRDIATNSNIIGGSKAPDFDPSCFDAESGSEENKLALPRIAEGSDVSHFDDAYFSNVPSLRFVDTIKNTIELSEGIETTASNILKNGSLGSVSMWDALMHASQMFHFTIIPLVQTAVCAPIATCLTGAWFRTIKASEYYDLRANYAVTRMLRGILMDSRFLARTGVYEDTPHAHGWGGCYMVDADDNLSTVLIEQAKRGAIEFCRPPEWLDLRGLIEATETTNTIPPGPAAVDAPLVKGYSNFSHTMMGRKASAPEPLPESTLKNTQREVGDLYCKSVYWERHLLFRTAELTGKLRFDVAAGSIIRIESLDGKLAADDGTEGDPSYMFGMVTSVRTVINCQNGEAHTSLVLAYLRTEAEKDFGTADHPLYKFPWVGTVLQRVTNVSDTFSPEQPVFFA
jgi:hypothetical protein